MSHQLSGIVSSFKTQDEHPNIILLGNYRFIPQFWPGHPNSIEIPRKFAGTNEHAI